CYEEEVIRKVNTPSGKDSFKTLARFTEVVKTDYGSKSCPQSTSYEPPLATSSSSTTSDTTKK
ncbi:hypothetical protein QR685DRAFT_453542, partial [Neurospora intermedia]